jgi:hypothetical protein
MLHCVLMKWQHAQLAASSSPWLTWTGRTGVARVWLPSGSGEGEEAIMGLFRRPKPNRKPTLRERRAAERTARAEASLVETEQKIHQIADDVRSDIKGSA